MRCRISVKVVGFVEPSESQQRRKRTRITNPDDEVEVPALKNLQIPQEVEPRQNTSSSPVATIGVPKITVEKGITSTILKSNSGVKGQKVTETVAERSTKGKGKEVVKATPQKNLALPVPTSQGRGEREKRELAILRKQVRSYLHLEMNYLLTN